MIYKLGKIAEHASGGLDTSSANFAELVEGPNGHSTVTRFGFIRAVAAPINHAGMPVPLGPMHGLNFAEAPHGFGSPRAAVKNALALAAI